MGRRRGSRGRSSSRRSRGKTGGQGSGGSGKGKGTGGSRGRSSGTRGGQGKGGSGKGKGTGGSRGRSNNTRGGQSKANRNQNKKARRTVRSVSKAVGGFAKRVGKSLKGAAANAATGFKGKPKSKLQQQLSNLKKDIAQKSTKEARFQRRADRLKKQFGLDYSDMRDMKINADVESAMKFAKLGWATKFLPKSVRDFKRNWSLGGKFRSPHKLGISDGFRRSNRGGGSSNVAADTQQVGQTLSGDDITNVLKETQGGNLYHSDIANMYKNLLGREFDQEGLNYWTKEHRSGRQSLDDIRNQFVKSEEFQGRSDAEKSAALAGLKQRRAARGQPVGVSRIIEELNKRGIRHSKSGNTNQINYGHFGIGIPGSPEYSRPSKSNRHLRGFPMIGSAIGTIGSLIAKRGKPKTGRRGRPGRRGGPIGSGTPGRRRPSPGRRGGGMIGLLPKPGGGQYGDSNSGGRRRARPRPEGPRGGRGDTRGPRGDKYNPNKHHRDGGYRGKGPRVVGRPWEGPAKGRPIGRPAPDERDPRPRGRTRPPKIHGDPGPRPRKKMTTSEAAIARFERMRRGPKPPSLRSRKRNTTGRRRVRVRRVHGRPS